MWHFRKPILFILPFMLILGVVGNVLAETEPPGNIARRAGTFSRFEKSEGSDTVASLTLQGKRTFRFDTFGDEAFWGDALKLHDLIQGSRFGGTGAGVSPKTALSLGLKVDSEALSSSMLGQLRRSRVDLDDPAVTLELLKRKAVVGMTGFFNPNGQLRSVGIQCALCHSTVDNSVAAGIGRRRDGWPNRDLNIGAIIALAPNLKPLADALRVDEATAKTVLNAWGPGKFDAELALDGKGFRPDGKSAATLIPPAFGLAGVNLHTWTGWGSVTYWNAFVAILEMHGKGNFFDPRLNNSEKFPLAVANGLNDVRTAEDRVTSKLAALHYYQLGLVAPKPSRRTFDPTAAAAGEVLFNNKAKCGSCHVPPLFTESGWNMHSGAEIGIDEFQASRSPDGRYRTAPLRGLWTHTKGGFFHDGRFATIEDVVNHYNAHFSLDLSNQEVTQLVEYLKSI